MKAENEANVSQGNGILKYVLAPQIAHSVRESCSRTCGGYPKKLSLVSGLIAFGSNRGSSVIYSDSYLFTYKIEVHYVPV